MFCHEGDLKYLSNMREVLMSEFASKWGMKYETILVFEKLLKFCIIYQFVYLIIPFHYQSVKSK